MGRRKEDLSPVGRERHEVFNFTDMEHVIDCASERDGKRRAETIATRKAFKTNKTYGVFEHTFAKTELTYICWFEEGELHAYNTGTIGGNSPAICEFLAAHRHKKASGLHLLSRGR